MAKIAAPSFKEYLKEKGRTVSGCLVCDLPEDVLKEVNDNEETSRPERVMMLEWLAVVEPDSDITKFKLYNHREKCLGLGRSTGRPGVRA